MSHPATLPTQKRKRHVLEETDHDDNEEDRKAAAKVRRPSPPKVSESLVVGKKAAHRTAAVSIADVFSIDLIAAEIVAIAHVSDVKSLRDLTAKHLPLLKNILEEGTV